MIRQNLATNPSNNAPLFPVDTPGMAAQMALLSAMMIDYVSKVAPEKLSGDNSVLKLSKTQAIGTTAATCAPISNKRSAMAAFNEDDVHFLGESFGLNDDYDE